MTAISGKLINPPVNSTVVRLLSLTQMANQITVNGAVNSSIRFQVRLRATATDRERLEPVEVGYIPLLT